MVSRHRVRLPNYRHETSTTPGALAALSGDIEAHGLRLPAVAVEIAHGTGYQLLAGKRRWLAFGQVWRGGSADLVVINHWTELLLWLAADRSLEADRAPYDHYEGLGFFRLIQQHLPTGRNDRPEKALMGYCDLGLHAARHYRYLHEAVENATEDETVKAVAREQIARVDAGTVGVDAGYKMLKEARERQRNPGASPERPSVWLKAMPNALDQLDGVVAALAALGPVPESLSSTQRQEWTRRLREHRSALGRIQREVMP